MENQPRNMNDSFSKNRTLVHIMSLNCQIIAWILELADALTSGMKCIFVIFCVTKIHIVQKYMPTFFCSITFDLILCLAKFVLNIVKYVHNWSSVLVFFIVFAKVNFQYFLTQLIFRQSLADISWKILKNYTSKNYVNYCLIVNRI